LNFIDMRNKENEKSYQKEWRKNNPDYNKKWKRSNHERVKDYREKYKIENPDYHKEWIEENKDKAKSTRLIYENRKNKENPYFKLNKNIKNAIWRSLRGRKNGRHWETLVGYTREELCKHLEVQFKDGMTWNNYGRNGWHVDHIIPVSLFNVKGIKSKGFKACWILENLRPMWEKDNISKHNKLFI